MTQVTATTKATETKSFVTRVGEKKPAILIADSAIKTLKIAFLMVTLAGRSFSGDLAVQKVMWGMRALMNGILLIADSPRIKKALSDEETKGIDAVTGGMGGGYRIVALIRDSFNFGALFTSNGVVGDAAQFFDIAATTFSSTGTALSIVTFVRKRQDKSDSGKDRLDLANNAADMAGDLTSMPWLPDVKALAWVSLSTATVSSVLSVIGNGWAIRKARAEPKVASTLAAV